MKTSEVRIMNELHRAGYGFEKAIEMLPELLTLRRLANKHYRLAAMNCNGEGIVGGRFYRLDGSMPEAYIDQHKCETNICEYESHKYWRENTTGHDAPSIFEYESEKVEAKIKAIVERLGLRVEFQGDPREYTVKIFKGERFLDIQR